MKKLVVGLDAYGFASWAGGLDVLMNIAEGLESTGRVQTICLFDEDSIMASIWRLCGIVYRNRCNVSKISAERAFIKEKRNACIHLLKQCSKNTIVFDVKSTKIRSINNREKKIVHFIEKNKVDILFPSTTVPKFQCKVPRVGYLFDFQHKYFRTPSPSDW